MQVAKKFTYIRSNHIYVYVYLYMNFYSQVNIKDKSNIIYSFLFIRNINNQLRKNLCEKKEKYCIAFIY